MSLATLTSEALQAAHRQFEAALPQIDNVARFQFRGLPRSQRRDAVADARAAAWHAWYGLLRRGQDPLAVGPTGIAVNACRYVRNGRRLGCGPTGRGKMDVYHPTAQRRCGFQLVGLDRCTGSDLGAAPAHWRERLAVRNRVTPADEASFCVDFEAWLAGLPERKREMAELLLRGHETGAVAALLGVTPAAVSIARGWLESSWRAFQGEPPPERATAERRGPGRPRKTGGAAHGANGRHGLAHGRVAAPAHSASRASTCPAS